MNKTLPYIVYGLISLFVLGPMLAPGYVFLLDFVWGPKFQLPDFTTQGVPPQYLLILLLNGLSFFIPVWMLQKITLFITMLSIPTAMYMFSRAWMPKRYALLSGILYVLNPYVYERLFAGQWLVLLGYAFFPIFLLILKFAHENPSRSNIIVFIAVFSLYPLINLHWAYLGYLFFAIFLLFTVTKNNVSRAKIKHSSLALLLGAFVWIIINSFWLLSITRPESSLSRIGGDDFRAFQTVSDPEVGRWINVLNLYGFWQDSITLPKETLNYWWLFGLILCGMSIVGWIIWHNVHQNWAYPFALMAILGLVLGVGYAEPIIRPSVIVLYTYLPGFKGLRETAKVIGWIAFFYSVFVPLAIQYIVRNYAKSYQIIILFIVACFSGVSVHTMWWGGNNQVSASFYPTSWYEVEVITTQLPNARLMVLPWHSYMRFPFSDDRLVAQPTRVFYTVDVITSTVTNNPYFTQLSELDQKILNWLNEIESSKQASVYLKQKGVTHIVLNKTEDWDRYNFLLSPEFTVLLDRNELILFEVN